jgi:hypothetical protein
MVGENMFLQIAISSLAVGAFFDGWSTNAAIRRGAHEADPVMVEVFGTSTPTAMTVYLRGGLVIASEAALALVISHFYPHVGIGVAVALLAQAGIHMYESIHNLKQGKA